MQIQLERSRSTDRRHVDLSSTIIPGPGRRWYEASFGPLEGGGDNPCDPYDPYCEPVKDQDDD
jgi:hypothetical protein